MKILIAGGCGFIRSNIAIYLKNQYKNKTAVRYFYRKVQLKIKKKNLERNIKVIKCDIKRKINSNLTF